MDTEDRPNIEEYAAVFDGREPKSWDGDKVAEILAWLGHVEAKLVEWAEANEAAMKAPTDEVAITDADEAEALLNMIVTQICPDS